MKGIAKLVFSQGDEVYANSGTIDIEGSIEIHGLVLGVIV
jgi:hypothetical protein